MPFIRSFPHQPRCAPKLWNKPNSGNPTPGKRIVYDSSRMRITPELDKKYWSAMSQRRVAIGNTGDRALTAVEDAEVRRRAAEGGDGKAKQSRERWEKQVRLAMSWEAMQGAMDTYKNSKVTIQKHYDIRSQRTGLTNKSSVPSFFNGGFSSQQFNAHYWNRRVSPRVTKKNQIDIDEGDAKYGWKGKRDDPFLREGPGTQFKGCFKDGVRVDDLQGDFSYFRPAGVPRSLKKYYHQNDNVKGMVHKHLSHRLRGDRMFNHQMGGLNRRGERLIQWYTDLVNQDVPRNDRVHINFHLNDFVHKPGPTRNRPTMAQASRHERAIENFESSGRMEFRSSLQSDSVRLERPDYC
eukprot:TRINITY_DN27282_c0_g1_i1.p2 TRINITY_DN27282_c0_g1~~TRINITY_DN27282_c0_g1_i1.p2  ORF type:complete len:351 (+),score=112.59 TRINITY_DN27282_c0_g1_i1:89-1141(+)